MKKLHALTILLAATLIAGCSSIDSRIKQNSATFAQLSPRDQQIIRYGYIAVGFTPDMVYMALDNPEKKIPGPGPNDQTWVYRNFYQGGTGGMPMPDQTPVGSGMEASNHRGTSIAATAPAKAGPRNTVVNSAYDAEADAIKEAARIRIHVIFTDGKVSDIRVAEKA